MECSIAQNIIDLADEQYPDKTLTAPLNLTTQAPYASHSIGLFFDGIGHILGVDPQKTPQCLNRG